MMHRRKRAPIGKSRARQCGGLEDVAGADRGRGGARGSDPATALCQLASTSSPVLQGKRTGRDRERGERPMERGIESCHDDMIRTCCL